MEPVRFMDRLMFARSAYVRQGWQDRVVHLAPDVWPTNPEDYVPFEGWAAGPSTHKQEPSLHAYLRRFYDGSIPWFRAGSEK